MRARACVGRGHRKPPQYLRKGNTEKRTRSARGACLLRPSPAPVPDGPPQTPAPLTGLAALATALSPARPLAEPPMEPPSPRRSPADAPRPPQLPADSCCWRASNPGPAAAFGLPPQALCSLLLTMSTSWWAEPRTGGTRATAASESGAQTTKWSGSRSQGAPNTPKISIAFTSTCRAMKGKRTEAPLACRYPTEAGRALCDALSIFSRPAGVEPLTSR